MQTFCFQAASVFPSDEDGLMFSLNAANGDIYKLRGIHSHTYMYISSLCANLYTNI